MTNDDIEAFVHALTLQYGMVFSAIAENTQIILAVLNRLDARHADDVARRVAPDDLRVMVREAVQEIASGNMALPAPDHSPTEQDSQQLLQILHRLGRMEGFMVGMQKQIDMLAKSTPSVPDKSTPEFTRFQGQHTPAQNLVPERLVPESQGQVTPASQASYTHGVHSSGTDSGTRNTPLSGTGTKRVKSSGTKSTPSSGTNSGTKKPGTKASGTKGVDLSGTKGPEWQEAQRAKIAAYEADHPGASVREIADAIGISKSSVDRLRKK